MYELAEYCINTRVCVSRRNERKPIADYMFGVLVCYTNVEDVNTKDVNAKDTKSCGMEHLFGNRNHKCDKNHVKQHAKIHKDIKNLLNDNLDLITKDCEVYPEMTYEKAFDTMMELSHLMNIYDKQDIAYTKLSLLYNEVSSSFPPRGTFTEAPKGYKDSEFSISDSENENDEENDEEEKEEKVEEEISWDDWEG
jgi:hypothetical protein